jgi:uroporphyrinogen decarboxylase
MSESSNEESLLIKALCCNNQSPRPPIWLMRQAGRYMPQYRDLRAKFSFLQMCHEPELISTVTQLPVDAFGMDAAILFSDILMIPEALRVGLRFDEGVGPIIEHPLESAEDLYALPKIDVPSALHFVAEGISLLKRVLKVPLIGFAGAPFTIASYMIEGRSSRDFKKTKQWMLRDPASFHLLLNKISDCTISYLKMQIAAGVDALQLFDSWAGALAYSQFREFSLAYLKRIVELLQVEHPRIPIILFCKGSSAFYKDLAEILPAAISLDSNCDVARVRKEIANPFVTLQGNLDPDILYAPSDVIKKEVRSLLERMKNDPGYIFNLGHGIHPDTPIDAVKVLVDCVKSF